MGAGVGDEESRCYDRSWTIKSGWEMNPAVVSPPEAAVIRMSSKNERDEEQRERGREGDRDVPRAKTATNNETRRGMIT